MDSEPLYVRVLDEIEFNGLILWAVINMTSTYLFLIFDFNRHCASSSLASTVSSSFYFSVAFDSV